MKSLILIASLLVGDQDTFVPTAIPVPSVSASESCAALRAEAVALAESRVRRTEGLVSAMNAGQAAVQERQAEAQSQARVSAAVSAASSLASLIPGVGMLAGLAGTVGDAALSGGGDDLGAVRAAEAQLVQAQQQMTDGMTELARMQEVALQMQTHGC